MQDQLAAAAEARVHAVALGSVGGGVRTAGYTPHRPQWWTDAMAVIKDIAAGRREGTRCQHLIEPPLLSVPIVIWAEDPTRQACVECDVQTRSTVSRLCLTCGAALAVVGGTERFSILGPLTITATWCPSCPLPPD